GGTETITVDVRILAATNSDLEARVAAGTFRSDLYYRLKVVTIHVPPLRDRTQDIPMLTHRFFELFKQENARPALQLAPETLAALGRARWEGNVRELRNLMESLVVLADASTQVIGLDQLPETYRSPQPAVSPAAAGGSSGPARRMEEIEREAILRT